MNYAGLRGRSASLIRKMGKPVTLRVPGDSSLWAPGYDEQGDYWTRTEAPFDVVRVNPIVPVDWGAYAVEDRYERAEIDGTLVQAQDRRFWVSGIDAAGAVLPRPETTHVLIVSGTELKIVTVKPVEPGPVAVVYEVQARV